MATIKFSNGTSVNFKGTPTEKDVEEVAQKLGIGKTTPTQQQTVKPKRSYSQRVLQAKGLDRFIPPAMQDFLVGARKGVQSTVRGASSLGEQGLRKLFRQDETKPLSVDVVGEKLGLSKEQVTPEGAMEKTGFAAEKIAEFLIPSGMSTTAAGAVGYTGKGAGLLKAGVKAATEAGVAGGITGVQKGDLKDDDVKTAMLVSGLFSLAGSGISALKEKAAPALGKKIQETVLKPKASDLKDGFKIENVSKYKVGGGNAATTLAKTESKLNQLTGQLDDALKGSDETVDLFEVYDDVAAELGTAKKARQFGDVKSIKRVLKNLEDEIFEQTDDGIVNLVDATNIKRGAGKKGAWVFGSADPDANATQKVYNTFYRALKDKINKVAPKSVSEINKQLSDLIPISNVALKRIPVESRNSVLSLTDTMGLYASIFDPKALALIGADRLSKSGKFGQFLINVSEKTVNPKFVNTAKSILLERATKD